MSILYGEPGRESATPRPPNDAGRAFEIRGGRAALKSPLVDSSAAAKAMLNQRRSLGPAVISPE